MNIVKVDGPNTDHKVLLYALSTCGHCKRVKEFMSSNGIAYEYIDVDKASKEDQREIIMFMKDKKLPIGFPLTMIDDNEPITGFRPEDFKKVLGL